MKRFTLLFVLAIGAILPARGGDDARIARFDVQRVFDQYERTKDIKKDLEVRRNTRGPQVEQDIPASERREKLAQRLDELKSKLKDASLGAAERERLAGQVRLVTIQMMLEELRQTPASVEHDEAAKAALKAQLDVVQRTLEAVDREARMTDEVSRQRAEILSEIWAMAAKLRTERGYLLIVPVNGPSEDQFLTIIVSEKADDIAGELLGRLNAQYSTRKAK